MMDLYKAIEERISDRKYENKSLSDTQIEFVNKELLELKALYPDIKVRFEFITEKSKTEHLYTGMIGSYGKIDAPYCLVAISEDKPGYMENIGFIQEQLVLKLTDLSIGTCWLAGTFSREKTKEIVKINQNEIITNVIAIGFPRDSLYNKGIRKMLGCTKRKPNKEIAFYKKWNEDITSFLQNNAKLEKILNMSVRYPSAANKQPVRVVFGDTGVAFFTKAPGNEYKRVERLDAGIFIAHFYLSCLEEGLSVDFVIEKETLAEISVPDGFSYVCTINYK